jgi:hypothetical protein
MQIVVLGCFILLIAAQPLSDEFKKWEKRRWFLLGGLFCYMAVDDAAQLHERFGSTLKIFLRGHRDGFFGSSINGHDVISFFPTYLWQLINLPIYGSMAVLIILIVFKDIKIKWGKILLFTTLVGYVTAVSLDFLEGALKYSQWDALKYSAFAHGKMRTEMKFIEEFLEMAVTTSGLMAILLVLCARQIQLKVSFNKTETKEDKENKEKT